MCIYAGCFQVQEDSVCDNLSSEKWEMRDLELYGLTNAEKYMLLAFEIGLAL